MHESPVIFALSSKIKQCLWVTVSVWWSFKIRHKRKLNKPQSVDSSRSNLIFPCLGTRTQSFSLNLPLCVVNTHFSCGLTPRG